MSEEKPRSHRFGAIHRYAKELGDDPSFIRTVKHQLLVDLALIVNKEGGFEFSDKPVPNDDRMRELRVECFVLNHEEASRIRKTIEAIQEEFEESLDGELSELLGHVLYLLKVD